MHVIGEEGDKQEPVVAGVWRNGKNIILIAITRREREREREKILRQTERW